MQLLPWLFAHQELADGFRFVRVQWKTQ
jgi:hypothetical protein